jgi:predicted membrane GTPase involved in stress response
LRNNVLTATAGEAIMNHRFKAYEPYKGHIPGRINGSLISMETGPGTAYAIDKLQDRGFFFVDPGEEVYMGQVIGEHNRQNDIVVNIQKGKQLTNMRASGSDTNVRITPKSSSLWKKPWNTFRKMNTWKSRQNLSGCVKSTSTKMSANGMKQKQTID